MTLSLRKFVHSTLAFAYDRADGGGGSVVSIPYRSIEAVPWIDPADGTTHLGCVRVEVVDPGTADLLRPGMTGRLTFTSHGDGRHDDLMDDFGPVRVAGRFPSGSVERMQTWTVVFEPADRARDRRAER